MVSIGVYPLWQEFTRSMSISYPIISFRGWGWHPHHLILFSQRLFESALRQLAERFTQIQGGLTAVERIGELLEEQIEISDLATSQRRPCCRPFGLDAPAPAR